MTEIWLAVLEIISVTNHWRADLQDTWMVVLLVTALIWGGGPERAAIIIWIVVHEIGRFVGRYLEGMDMTFKETWTDLNVLNLQGDGLLLIGFVALALVANRRYTIWIAALQVLAFLALGVRAYSDEVTIFVYMVLTYGAGWAQIFLMTGGQIAHARRKKGVYASWVWQVRKPSRASTSRASADGLERNALAGMVSP